MKGIDLLYFYKISKFKFMKQKFLFIFSHYIKYGITNIKSTIEHLTILNKYKKIFKIQKKR
jgi:hypothetical protein